MSIFDALSYWHEWSPIGKLHWPVAVKLITTSVQSRSLLMIDLSWSRLKLGLNDPWTICEAFFHLLPSALLAFIILYQQSIAHVHSALNYMKKCMQRTSKCSIRTIKADVAEWVLKKQTNDQIHPLSHFSRGQFKSRTNKLGFPVQ